MPGVVVVDKNNSKNGTVTDLDGKYKIKVAQDGFLEFSFMSYNNALVPVEGKKVLNVSLTPSLEQLEKVVVIKRQSGTSLDTIIARAAFGILGGNKRIAVKLSIGNNGNNTLAFCYIIAVSTCLDCLFNLTRLSLRKLVKIVLYLP